MLQVCSLPHGDTLPTVAETVDKIAQAQTLDQRVAEIRLVPRHHGSADCEDIYAAVARQLYVPDLAPDFAYVHEDAFYGESYFEGAYNAANTATSGFTQVAEADLASVVQNEPRTLLVFRTILGLTKQEFAHSTTIVATRFGLTALSGSKVDSMERRNTRTNAQQAAVVAKTITMIMEGSLFAPAPTLTSKQAKPDTRHGWSSVQQLASGGVPFSLFLHQRHYGGAFRQLLDATSTQRGGIIEDAVRVLLDQHRIPFVQTSMGNQPLIAARFQVTVQPTPDFVIYDPSGLRAMLECKGANDGGTARDKAARFGRLRQECTRLGGVPLFAVLGGIGWTRVNDTLGPVVRDTDGRVFTLATLATMLNVAPFPSLVGIAPIALS